MIVDFHVPAFIGGALVVNILVFDLRVELQHCTYQGETLLFALIKVNTFICKREISVKTFQNYFVLWFYLDCYLLSNFISHQNYLLSYYVQECFHSSSGFHGRPSKAALDRSPSSSWRSSCRLSLLNCAKIFSSSHSGISNSPWQELWSLHNWMKLLTKEKKIIQLSRFSWKKWTSQTINDSQIQKKIILN